MIKLTVSNIFKITGILILLVILFFAWKFYIRFTPLFLHQSIVISLPFAAEDDDLIFINPMGETDHHTPPQGHPGLDFGWSHPAPLIAVADGKVTKIKEDSNKEYGVAEKVYDVEIVSGKFAIRYDGIAPAQNLRVGMKVKQGDVIGRGGKYEQSSGVQYSTHWEFDYDTMIFDRLCPMIFFDANSEIRINLIWNRVGQTYNGQFPEVCSGFYKGKIN
ncbi:MAG: M23 family metallopeptidase [Patescibacteria group bacterium]